MFLSRLKEFPSDEERTLVRATIVLAEDDLNILQLLHAFLTNKGYEVYKAVDGEEALHLVEEVKPDLLITDVMMPKLNGYQLVHALTTDHYDLPTPKIIVLTSRADPADVKRGLNVGADVYISKPFNIEEIGARVRDLLSGASAGPKE
jgi:DNA-binding response OmpR family regulator